MIRLPLPLPAHSSGTSLSVLAHPFDGFHLDFSSSSPHADTV